MSLPDPVKQTRKPKHEHEWFPIAIDYDERFIILECSECSERAWTNAHPLEPKEIME